MEKVEGWLNQVIDSGNAKEIDNFLFCFKKYAKKDDVYGMWKQNFESKPETRKNATQLIRTWVEYFSEDWTANQLLEIMDTLGELKSNSFKLAYIRKKKKPSQTPQSSRKVSAISISEFHPGMDRIFAAFFDISSSSFAKTLTSREYRIFRTISSRELLKKYEWIPESNNNAEEESQDHSNSCQKLIETSNSICAWIKCEIVSRVGKSQKMFIQKIIDVARSCEQLNNFNALMEILSALNDSSVRRLKKVWNNIDDKYMKQFNELDAIMTPEGNYKRYREELKKRTPPMLPYFGLFLKDFVFINENNPYGSDGSINLDTISLVGDIVRSVKAYQEVPYNLEENEKVNQLLENLWFIKDEDMLYKLSLKSEPSNFSFMEEKKPSVEWEEQCAYMTAQNERKLFEKRLIDKTFAYPRALTMQYMNETDTKIYIEYLNHLLKFYVEKKKAVDFFKSFYIDHPTFNTEILERYITLFEGYGYLRGIITSLLHWISQKDENSDDIDFSMKMSEKILDYMENTIGDLSRDVCDILLWLEMNFKKLAPGDDRDLIRKPICFLIRRCLVSLIQQPSNSNDDSIQPEFCKKVVEHLMTLTEPSYKPEDKKMKEFLRMGQEKLKKIDSALRRNFKAPTAKAMKRASSINVSCSSSESSTQVERSLYEFFKTNPPPIPEKLKERLEGIIARRDTFKKDSNVYDWKEYKSSDGLKAYTAPTNVRGLFVQKTEGMYQIDALQFWIFEGCISSLTYIFLGVKSVEVLRVLSPHDEIIRIEWDRLAPGTKGIDAVALRHSSFDYKNNESCVLYLAIREDDIFPIKKSVARVTTWDLGHWMNAVGTSLTFNSTFVRFNIPVRVPRMIISSVFNRQCFATCKRLSKWSKETSQSKSFSVDTPNPEEEDSMEDEEKPEVLREAIDNNTSPLDSTDDMATIDEEEEKDHNDELSI